ncbi:MAG: efflux RND transporter permease subunit [Acidobacteria bacterium]|nr:efflux RND transporter permease subunit [Acidobacteriota bacterium]
MLPQLVEGSIRYRGVVIAVACVVVGYGFYTLSRARFDVYPEFAPPQVVVQTEAPGLSPEDVEQLVTRPLENSLNGAPNLEWLRSQSIQGLSVVTVLFREGTDVYRARQIVSERMDEAAAQMPQGVMAPVMAPLTGATSMVLIAGLTSDVRSPMDLRTFAQWTLSPRLLAVPGVARVSLYGGDVRQLQIQLLPERLAGYHLSVNDVVAAARTASGVRGAGFVETAAQRIVLQTQAQSLKPEELGRTVVSVAGGRTIRLQDVATVTEGAEPKIGDATVMGRPGVLLIVSSQYGVNTVEVTNEIEKALGEMRPAIEAAQMKLQPDLFRPATFVMTAVRNMGESLLLGGLLVAGVLLLFLWNARVAFISLTAIPLSLLVAVIILHHAGESLNTLTLGGLAIAIGEVVDDAIIDVENIFRRVRETGRRLAAGDLFATVLNASIEVRTAVVYATLIVALVFLPVLAMSGIQGRLFAPLALSYILAIMASLLVALTVTPALSYLLLAATPGKAAEPPYILRLKARYGELVRGLGSRPQLVMAAALMLAAAAAAAIPFLGGSFLPELREGHFIVHMVTLPGTSLQESVRLGKLVSKELLQNPRVRSVAQQIGRAERADDTWGPHYSEIHVALKAIEGEEVERAESEIREIMGKFPGISSAPKTFLTERIEEVLSGQRAEVAVKIFGNDLDVLDQKAAEVAQAIAGVRGAADVAVESPPGTPELVIRLKPQRLLQFGFQPVPALEAIRAAYQGAVVGQAYEGNRVSDIVVMLTPELRADPESVGSLLLHNGEGLRAPLKELADIYETKGRYMVAHDETRRRQAVTCNVRGRDLSSFVAEARRAVREKVQLPGGVYADFSGAVEARRQAQREILVYSLIAATGIVLLLCVAFRNFRNALLVLANLPFALVGGVLAAMFTGGELSVGSIVGFVTLFGISTRNSMMMISHYEHLVKHEGETWGLYAAVRGASERLTPVLMTAIVTALGLLPLALSSGEPGKEIEGPMASVILGGLVTSTVLNLLVLPAVALRFGRFAD